MRCQTALTSDAYRAILFDHTLDVLMRSSKKRDSDKTHSGVGYEDGKGPRWKELLFNQTLQSVPRKDWGGLHGMTGPGRLEYTNSTIACTFKLGDLCCQYSLPTPSLLREQAT